MVLASGVGYKIKFSVFPGPLVCVSVTDQLPFKLNVKVPAIGTPVRTVPPTENDATPLVVPPLLVALGK